MELNPKPTLLEVSLWCRMIEKTLLLYLKHNGVGGDTSNRTDAISGCQSLSFAAVSRWCATKNPLVSAERILALLGALGLGDVDNFVRANADALRRHLSRMGSVSLGEEEALVAAHANFAQVVGTAGTSAQAVGDHPGYSPA
eukprot:1365465-Prymnesium_polylepis.1